MGFSAPNVSRAKVTFSDGSVHAIPVDGRQEFDALTKAIVENKGCTLTYGALAPPTSKGPRPLLAVYEEADLTPTRR